MDLSLIDVFAGVGGFTLGFEGQSHKSPFRVVPRLLVDIDRSARAVCLRNMPAARYLSADIHTLSGPEIRDRAGLQPNDPLHILLGGPPCQGFSFLGKRLLDDPRNVHVVDFLRLVKELRPIVAVMENVPLIVTSHGGAVIREVCEGLSSLGYNTCANVLQANEYGVPQIRRRAFVIAYRKDLRTPPEMPTRTHERVTTATELTGAMTRMRFEPEKTPYVSVEEAIGDLPQIAAGEGDEVMYYNHPPFTDYQRRARAGSIAVFNHRSRVHSAAFLKKVSVIKEGGANKSLPSTLRFSDNYYSQAYARLGRSGLANTITTSFANPGSGRYLHYRDLRSITVREAARLQSFPDNFVFDGDLTAQMRHVGNAVPPLLARAVRDKVLEDLGSCLSPAYSGSSVVASPKPKEDPRVRSATMRAVPSKNTTAEIRLRKALSAAGIRGYRTHSSKVPGNPDVVFGAEKVAVFVDGCFWHGCPRCYREPASNKTYWQMKVDRNRDRDKKVTSQCRQLGWKVIRFWEHDILKNAEKAAARVRKLLRERRKKRQKIRAN
jgi:DNA (cytosine-5)-methyltransferase 1